MIPFQSEEYSPVTKVKVFGPSLWSAILIGIVVLDVRRRKFLLVQADASEPTVNLVSPKDRLDLERDRDLCVLREPVGSDFLNPDRIDDCL